MQTVSGSLAASCLAKTRYPRYRVEIAWDPANPTTYTDESANVVKLSGRSEAAKHDAGPSAIGPSVSDTLTIDLHNVAGRYSASRTDGALYGYIGGNGGYERPVKVSVGMATNPGPSETVEYCQVFWGHLLAPLESRVEEIWPDRVTFQALDLAGRAASKKIYTPLYSDKRADEYITSLAALLSPAPTAIMCDVGLGTYPWLWADGETVWGDICRVAEAEAGWVWFDGLGNLRYHNYLHLLQIATAQATFTRDEFEDLTPDFDFQNAWPHVTVSFRTRYAAGLQEVWAASEVIAVPPSTTKTLWAKMTNPVLANSLATPIPYTVGAADGAYDYKARTASYVDKTASITITVGTTYAQRALLSIANAHATLTLYLDYLRLRGSPILSVQEDNAEAPGPAAVAALDNDRTLPVDNLFVQSEAAAQSIADMLLARYQAPRRVVTLQNVWGLPYQEVGDLIHIDDTGVTPASGIHGDFVITSFAWRCDRNWYQQDITAIDAAALLPYSNYFWVGTDDAHCTALGTAGRFFF
jgi:hypothetical protein